MGEPILRNRTSPEPIPITETPAGGREAAGEMARKVRTATEELIEELRARWEDLRDRTEKEAAAVSRSLGRELSEDADYVRIRARYYHENRPLQTLGAVAAVAFVLGLALGFWRR